VGHHDFGGRNPIEIHRNERGDCSFCCWQIVVFINGKEMGGKELFVRMGRDFGAAVGEGMTGPQHKVAEGSVGVLKIIVSHSLMMFREDVFCVPIFSTLKLIVTLLPYTQVLLNSNNWTNPNKNYWDFGQT